MKHTPLACTASVLCTVLLILTLLSGCTDTPPTLLERGEALIGQLTQLQTAQDSISALYGENYVESAAFSAFASSKYDSPQAVYEIRFTDGVYSVLGVSEEELQGMPPVLRDQLHSAKASTVISNIVSKQSPEEIALLSLLRASTCFTDTSVTESFLHLYVYEAGTPIVISFQPQNDGIVQASASPLLLNELDTSTAEGIAEFFKGALGKSDLCTVTKIA